MPASGLAEPDEDDPDETLEELPDDEVPDDPLCGPPPDEPPEVVPDDEAPDDDPPDDDPPDDEAPVSPDAVASGVVSEPNDGRVESPQPRARKMEAIETSFNPNFTAFFRKDRGQNKTKGFTRVHLRRGASSPAVRWCSPSLRRS
jgi:hypothetical protein